MKKSLSKQGLAADLLTVWLCSYLRYRWAVARKQRACIRLGNALNTRINIASLRFSLTGAIIIKGLNISKGNIQAGTALLRVNIHKRAALRGRLRLSACYIEQLEINIKAATEKATDTAGEKTGEKPPNAKLKFPHAIYRKGFRLFNTIMRYMPEKLDIPASDISVSIAGKKINLHLRELQLANMAYRFKISGTENAPDPFILQGKWIPAERRVTLEECQGGTYFSSEHLLMELNGKQSSALNFQLTLKEALIHWETLSLESIRLSQLELNVDLHLLDAAFEIAETSYLQYNDVFINFYATHNYQEEDVLQASLHMDSIPMNQFLRSFPSFIYRKLYEVEFSGNIPAFDMVLALRLDNPFNHIFEIKVDEEEESPALTMAPGIWPDLEQSFKHDAYDNGRYIKSIHLCQREAGYVTIESLPSILISIIINTEDPNFEYHNGVDTISVGYAIIRNLLNKRFVSGASTITMQLVRNLFLGHHKNIYRKIEEVLIAMLLENVCGVSKKRIMELYFNIIEFAPGIYGIKDAAEHYFMKSPSELTPQECLVLTYIIPRPKYFLEAFLASSAQLKRNLHNHIKWCSDSLVERTLMTAAEAAALTYVIKIQDHELSLDKPA